MQVFIADNEPKVRSALRLWLVEGSALEIVGELGDAWALFDHLGKVQPDVLLLDEALAGVKAWGTRSHFLATANFIY